MSRDNVIECIGVLAAIRAASLPMLKDLLPEGVLTGALCNQFSAFNRMTNKAPLQWIDLNVKIDYLLG